MILTKKVKIRVNNSAINHYKNLDYNVKTGQLIVIPIEHLSKGSNKKIEVQCHECGKINKIKYIAYLKQIKKYGFYTCKGKCSQIKNKQTKLERYGDENYSNPEKAKETCLKKYGTKHPMQTDRIKNKQKNSMMNKYGVMFASQTKDYIEKTNKTNIKKFGVSWSFQSENNKIKSKQTKKEKYGNENYNNIKKREKTCLDKYGSPSAFQNREIQGKIENTNIKKYGTKYPITTPKIKEKSKKTLFENFGVKNTWDSKEIKDKSKQTKKEKYGDENYVNSKKISKSLLSRTEEEIQIAVEKQRNTKQKKYGNPNYTNREKNNKTVKERYGVNNVSQNTNIYKKILSRLYRTKKYILPSGKIVKVQGYEPLALNLLFKKYKEKDLLIDDKEIEEKIGKIWYIKENGKKGRYYPDIYIISENKIIEVKSDYIFIKDKNNNLLKNQACLNNNLNFEFMMFNKKKQLLTEKEVKNLIKHP